jgi:hypothetical protein
VSERRPRRRRLLAIAAALGIVAAAAAAMLAWRHDRERGTYTIGFDLVGAETVADLGRIRQQHQLVIGAGDGTCTRGDTRPPEERFEGFEVRETRGEVVGSVRMRAMTEDCFGVGSSFRTTVRLSRPIGRRALIDDEGPHQFRFVLIPPTDRAEARRLVLPIRRDRRQPPPAIYTGPACDVVAQYLTDVPKRDWCQY